MNKTRLFIQKAPVLRNGTFEVASYEFTTYPRKGHLEYWDDFKPEVIVPPAPANPYYQYSPLLLHPYDGTIQTAAVQDINAGSGVYTFVVEVVKLDESQPYDGNISIGIGNRIVYLGAGGVASGLSTSLTEPTTYVFDLDVAEYNLNDPLFGNKLSICASGNAYYSSHPLKNLAIKNIYIKTYTTDEYNEIDLYDDVTIPITYNVADIRDISKKNSNWSLEVEIPNTSNNAQLFNHIHEIADYNSNFEMLRRYKCFVEVDNNRTFEGYLQLNEVTKNDRREIVYKCNLYSEVIEFVNKLGKDTLRGNEDISNDLDFSEYDVPALNETTIGPLTMIDDNNPILVHRGEGLFLSQLNKYDWNKRNLFRNYSNARELTQPIYWSEMTPCLWVKEIWDKIFEKAGYSYVSNFIQGVDTSTTFDFLSLAYPSTSYGFETTKNEGLTITQVNSNGTYNSEYSGNLGNTEIFGNLIGGGYIFDDINANLGEDSRPVSAFQYNPEFEWTCPTTGIYSLTTSIPIILYFQLSNWVSYLNHYVDAAYTGPVTGDTSKQYSVKVNCIHWDSTNNTETVLGGINYAENYESSYDFTNGITEISSIGDAIDINIDRMYIHHNDKIYFTISYILPERTGLSYTLGSYYHRPILELKKSSIGDIQFDLKLLSTMVYDGAIEATNVLNKGTTKIDFINNIIKKFNLYIEDVTHKKDATGHYYDDTNYYPNGKNKRSGEPIFRIEPRDIFYKNDTNDIENPGGIYRDWTNRTDFETIKFKRIDDYLYSKIDFNDTYDNDEWATKQYNDYKYTEGEYGEKVLLGPMYNINDDKKIEIKTKLGQTMCGPFNNDKNKSLFTSQLQAPFLFKYNGDNLVTDMEWSDRIFFAYNVIIGDTSPGFGLFLENESSFSSQTLRYAIRQCYIQLDTLNAPYGADTASLLFGEPNWWLQNLNGTLPDYRNCYNVFYKNMLDDYNNINARIMTCKMYLKPSDMRDVQLSNVIIIDGIAYHINKIKEWCNGKEPVEVELIKMISSHSEYSIQPTKNSSNVIGQKSVDSKTAIDTVKESINSVKSDVAKNIESIAKNESAVNDIMKQLSVIDERLKKLESGK